MLLPESICYCPRAIKGAVACRPEREKAALRRIRETRPWTHIWGEDVYPVMHLHIWVVRDSAFEWNVKIIKPWTHIPTTDYDTLLNPWIQVHMEWHRRYKVQSFFLHRSTLPPFITAIPFVFPIYNSLLRWPYHYVTDLQEDNVIIQNQRTVLETLTPETLTMAKTRWSGTITYMTLTFLEWPWRTWNMIWPWPWLLALENYCEKLWRFRQVRIPTSEMIVTP